MDNNSNRTSSQNSSLDSSIDSSLNASLNSNHLDKASDKTETSNGPKQEEATFDSIAQEYKDSKLLPFRLYAEVSTLFQLLGDLRDQSILDVACGEGIYTRKLKSRGAGKVVGVDISPEMIKLAEEEERKNPIGVEYVVRDAEQLGVLGKFDLVMASYLLNYAQSKEQLVKFLKNVFENLKPGGRFVGVNNNPANDSKFYSLYRPYGFIKSISPASLSPKEGDPITYTFYNEDGSHFNFDNYFLSKETHEEAFREVGFENFSWRPLIISQEGLEKMGESYWDAFLKEPPLICFEAQRPMK